MPMGTTIGAEMQPQVVVRGHGVGAMDFGCSKQVVAVTLVGTEKLDAREACSNAPPASHI